MRQLATQNEECEPFYVVDLGDVLRKLQRWAKLIPRVAPFYAVKCNNDPRILDTLAAAGTGFDCASRAEMEAMVSRGVDPANIIYAHPCKPTPHLLYAKKVGVTLMTVDNHQELVKIQTHYPDARLVLRVLVDDSYAICRLGTKFGCLPSETGLLLRQAQELGLNIMGVSFHVGSGCTNAKAFSGAVAVAARVFSEARALGFDMTMLDIGGGFPGQADAPVAFEDIADALTTSLDAHFSHDDPANEHLTIIAEPGRYFVASSASLAVNVIAKRSATDCSTHDYYVNDGVYGSFNCTLFDHQVVLAELLHPVADTAAAITSTIWGPTCDSMDCISRDAALPELQVGDFLVFHNMGAYTMAASSTFNGFPRPDIHYVFTSATANEAPAVTDQIAGRLSLRSFISPPESPATSDDEGLASSSEEDTAFHARRRHGRAEAGTVWKNVTLITI